MYNMRTASVGLGWYGGGPLSGTGPGYGFTVLQWEGLKYLRVYYEDYNDLLYEIYSGNGTRDWRVGQRLSE